MNKKLDNVLCSYKLKVLTSFVSDNSEYLELNSSLKTSAQQHSISACCLLLCPRTGSETCDPPCWYLWWRAKVACLAAVSQMPSWENEKLQGSPEPLW